MKFGLKLMKFIMLMANLIVAGMLILSLAGSVISPVKSVLIAYITLIFPFIVILNIGFVVFWAITRKWYFLISLFLLLIAIPQIRNSFPLNFGRIDNEHKGKEFTILSYNTRLMDAVKKHTHDDPNKIVKYLKENEADIVCLQEFGVGHKPHQLLHEDVLEIMKNYPYNYIVYKKIQGWCKYGNAFFSKYPIINADTVDYFSKYNISIYADLLIGKDTVRIINNHLESNGLTENDKAKPMKLTDNFTTDELTETTLHLARKLNVAYKVRAKQADVIAKYRDASPYKTIILGDLNDVPVSYVYSKIRGKRLNDAFVDTGRGFGWTFNESIYRFRIDYVLYDSSFSIVDFKVDKIRASDHYPMHCKLAINN
jgi:endonuclease/exonuclease/phosphatase family metal-dependent hydrolase